jgi:hypothetical protein
MHAQWRENPRLELPTAVLGCACPLVLSALVEHVDAVTVL